MADETAVNKITDVVARKHIPPVVIEFLLERAKNMQGEIKAAVRKEKEKSVSDRTKAPRSMYDLDQSITLKHLLAYVDDNAALGVDNRIGLEDIFGYNRDSFEKVISRPINAMYKMREDEILRKIVPEKIQHAGWPIFEKARAWAYEEISTSPVAIRLMLWKVALLIAAIYIMVYIVLSKKTLSPGEEEVIDHRLTGGVPPGAGLPREIADVPGISNKARAAIAIAVAIPMVLMTYFVEPMLIVAFFIASAGALASLVFILVKWKRSPPWEGLSKPGGKIIPDQFKAGYEREGWEQEYGIED